MSQELHGASSSAKAPSQDVRCLKMPTRRGPNHTLWGYSELQGKAQLGRKTAFLPAYHMRQKTRWWHPRGKRDRRRMGSISLVSPPSAFLVLFCAQGGGRLVYISGQTPSPLLPMRYVSVQEEQTWGAERPTLYSSYGGSTSFSKF